MAEDRARNMLAVSLVAGLAGAAAGVLFAPRSGRETRAKMRDTSRDMRNKAEETLDSGKSKARDLKERLTSAASDTGRKVKEGYEETRGELAS